MTPNPTSTLTRRIVIAMLAGIALGSTFNQFGPPAWAQLYVLDGALGVVGALFVAALKMMVVPLVFVSLVVGVTALSDLRTLGRVGAKALVLYLGTTALAVTVALALAGVVGPGRGFDAGTTDASFSGKPAPPLTEMLIGLVPTNPVAAMAEGNMLQIIVFALLMGIALWRTGEAGAPVRELFTGLNEVIMTLVTLLMHLAPYGVFCLLAKLIAEIGVAAILDLAKYFGTVLLGLLVHGVVIYSLLLWLLARRSPLTFFRNVRPALLFAFSTASSNATMPVTLNVTEQRLGVDNRVASFVVPLGATMNMDGTAIMQGVATVFIAQAYGLDLSWGGYLAVIATATLASIGAAGVPGVGLVTLVMVLEQVGLPAQGIGLIIGIDRLLDMARTAVNVCGDCVFSTIVASSEGLLDEAVFAEVSDRDRYPAGS